jgi:hypothetical protein
MPTILPVGHHRTVAYAAKELAGHLNAMTGERAEIEPRETYDPAAAGLWIGVAADFPNVRMPSVPDPAIDDAVSIEVDGEKGVLTGTNPRSALLAVYRYLTALGCRWVRPGSDGAFIPQKSQDRLSAQFVEKASYRHRGICIEGAVSEQHVRDIIEWAPRVGFNGYFIQFREAFTFFDRWYSHQGNPLLPPEEFSVERAREITARVVEEIEKRDLLYHAVGHGWTCEPFGLSGLGWDYRPVQASPDVEPYLALVNGKRQIWQGIPLNTNLCYSNPEVRRIVVEEIARYAGTHPEIDVLHFWLADGANNQCECAECVKARPSDFYVRMLNELDELLTRKKLPVRIVFLIYVDLLWPPERERIHNPDRFVMMFAPITRSYSKVFATEEDGKPLPPYHRNRLRFPRSVSENVAFLRAWQKVFGGDSFDFDYHFMWDHYNDPGYMQIASVLHGDVRRLASIGLNGFVSCQTQRAFFPTGLGMMAMGWTLWRSEADFDRIAADYFQAAFGPDGAQCRAYLAGLSDLFEPVYLRGEKPEAEAESQNVRNASRLRFAEIPEYVGNFRPVIERNLGAANPCHAASWRYLKHHADICELLAPAFDARARGDKPLARQHWETVMQTVRERESLLHPVLDVFLFIQTLEGKFRA